MTKIMSSGSCLYDDMIKTTKIIEQFMTSVPSNRTAIARATAVTLIVWVSRLCTTRLSPSR